MIHVSQHLFSRYSVSLLVATNSCSKYRLHSIKPIRNIYFKFIGLQQKQKTNIGIFSCLTRRLKSTKDKIAEYRRLFII